ncbi:MAG: SHOCT domain-containing protein [Thermoleophilaceae bacterium]
MRPNNIGWFIGIFFLAGGIFFWIVIPEIWIGQIWVVVALGLIGLFFFMSRRAEAAEKLKREGIPAQGQILEMTQTGMYVNEQPQVKLKLRVSGPGLTPFETEKKVVVPMIALGSLSSGNPLSVYVDRTDQSNITIDWSGAAAPATIQPGGQPIDLNANPAAKAAVMDTLRRHGIDPDGNVDLRQNPTVRAAVLEALKQQGVDAAHAAAAADPATPVEEKAGAPVDRMRKLNELKQAKLITDEEFAAQRQRILDDV